ncbi:MAG TPA: MFS transporter [Anaerolineales bacterium]|nr:MFS transporter [Anaerolineales bacterium]
MENSSQPETGKWAGRFFTIWGGQALSLFGSALVQFALIWWLTQESGSATVLAIASLVAMLPQILIGPFAGALVDRWDRRIIMIAADAMIAAVSLVLAYLFATDAVQIWHIYAVMAIRSLGGAFHFPAMAASTPLMVPESQLTRINGLNQALQGVNMLVAPPVGALLIGILSTHWILLIDVGTALLAILPLFFFSIPQPRRHEPEESEAKPNLLRDVRKGLAYIRTIPGFIAIILMALFLNFLLVPMAALVPLLVTKHFGKGAIELGIMESAMGIGILAGGILLSIWGGFKKKITTSLAGIIGLGIGVMLEGFAPADLFLLAIAGHLTLGFMLPIANGPVFAMMQSIVRPDMQGRVMSLVNSGATAISPLGLLIAGPFSDWLGIRAWFWAGGILCVLIAVTAFFVPAIMNVESHGEAPATPTSEPAQLPVEERDR